ncbi:MAG: hypothetical protein AAFN92_21380, partial [Bacteroidota bacterium]
REDLFPGNNDSLLSAQLNLDHLEDLLIYHQHPGAGSTYLSLLLFKYDKLVENGYFDTLSFRPNLRTLMTELEGTPPPGQRREPPQLGGEDQTPVQVPASTGGPIVVYTPENTPNIPFQITVVDDQTTATIAGATIQVYYYREAFGREYVSDRYGRAEVQLPLDLANTRVLVFANDYREKNWDARQKSADNQWICSMEPLVGGGGLGSVPLPDLNLIFAPRTNQDPVNSGLRDLAINLLRSNNFLKGNRRFNPDSEDINQVTGTLENQVAEIQALRDYLIKACLAPQPGTISIVAYRPEYRSNTTGNESFPDYAEYVRRAFSQDPDLARCLEQGILTISSRTERVEWPTDERGDALSEEHWRVRNAGRVTISYSVAPPAQGTSPRKID